MDRRSLLKILGLSPLVTLPVVAEAKLPEPAVTTALSSRIKTLDVLEGQMIMLVGVANPEGPGKLDVTRNGVAIYGVPVNVIINSIEGPYEIQGLPTSFVTLDIPGPGRHEYVITSTGGGTVDISASILSR